MWYQQWFPFGIPLTREVVLVIRNATVRKSEKARLHAACRLRAIKNGRDRSHRQFSISGWSRSHIPLRFLRSLSHTYT